MKRCFTHYWTNDTWNHNERFHGPGQPLEHTAGNLFRARKVATGDAIYVVTVRKGRLFLLGRLIVAKVCNVKEAAQALGCKEEDLWEADDHVIAASATAMHFDLEVPLAITQRLLFVDSKSSKPLRFVQPGILDAQTLRGVRQLDGFVFGRSPQRNKPPSAPCQMVA
jgi:hypothetical protein